MIGTVRILAVSGSLQARSSNKALLQTAHRVAPPGVELVDSVSVGDIAPFNPDVDRDGGTPAAVAEFRGQVKAADGVLIASPEYAHSLPGILKNALDWLVGTGELYEKPVAVLCASPRPTGGVYGREALERTLKAQGSAVVVSATVGVVAADKGAEELAEPEAVATIAAALDALVTAAGRTG
jgi:NAD(P)H-dependent FMN reductase